MSAGGPHPHALSGLARVFLRSSEFACLRARTATWCLAALVCARGCMMEVKSMLRRYLAVAFVVFAGLVLNAQQYPLAEVEVRMALHPHNCGMSGGTPCPRYEITIRGDGAVEYNGIGPVDGNRKRTISADAVVSLVNEFLAARFFDALDVYGGKTFIIRHGDTVSFSVAAAARVHG